MTNLGDAFYRASVVRKDEDVINALGRVITQGIGMFKLGRYTFYLDEGFYPAARKLVIEVEKLPGYSFTWMLDMLSLSQAYDHHAYLYETLRKPLFNHFRYRPSLPVEDHIILGED